MTAPDLCVFCDELVTPGKRADSNLVAHRTCMLRSATGGIGHLEDHAWWCLVMHDPDGGRSLYQSGLECDAWITAHGVDAAIADSTDGIPHPRKADTDV